MDSMSTQDCDKGHLVGGFNPFEKYYSDGQILRTKKFFKKKTHT